MQPLLTDSSDDTRKKQRSFSPSKKAASTGKCCWLTDMRIWKNLARRSSLLAPKQAATHAFPSTCPSVEFVAGSKCPKVAAKTWAQDGAKEDPFPLLFFAGEPAVTSEMLPGTSLAGNEK